MTRRFKQLGYSPPAFHLETLERRILFSADAAFMALDVVAVSDAELVVLQHSVNAEAAAESSVLAAEVQTRELVIIDSAVEDLEKLRDDLARSGREHTQVVVLDTQSDALTQISDILAKQRGLTALHVMSPGSSGFLELGGQRIETLHLLSQAEEIANWRSALAHGADLKLYGCDMEADGIGRQFIDTLTRLTGADVSAPSDLTESAEKGGDWQLEYRHGDVHSEVAVSAEVHASHGNAMLTSSVNRLNNAGAASLISSSTVGLRTQPSSANSSTEALDDALLTRQEILFLSPDVGDYQQLLHDIGSDVEVHIFAPDRDGVEQMVEVLAGRTGIDAIHLVGDGTQAQIHLGSSFLTQDSISTRYAEQFERIGQSLSAEADLLIYGCNFGEGDAGQDAVQTLATLTGADVAASDDRTGHANEFADWQLEVRTGSIESAVFISASAEAAWENVLAAYTVTNTSDNGVNSLRWAIDQANINSGADTIVFNIAGSGTQVINLSSALPSITEQVTIDGTTQTDWAVQSFMPIVIDGNGAAGAGLTFTSSAGNSEVRGLVIRDTGGDGIQIDDGASGIVVAGNWIGQFNSDGSDAGVGEVIGGNGIYIVGGNNTIGGTTAADRNVINEAIYLYSTSAINNVISGNYLGTDTTGNAVLASGGVFYGVLSTNSAALNTIGGATDAHRNIISAREAGIFLDDSGTSQYTIQNNWIGLGADGSTVLGSGNYGMFLRSGDNHVIGGIGTGNVILDSGIAIEYADSVDGTTVQGNYIGIDETGTVVAGNDTGIHLEFDSSNNTIGGISAGEGNVITASSNAGISTDARVTTVNNEFRGNAIYGNAGLGIDLGNDGVNANDTGTPNDADTGANGLQNWAVLTSVDYNGAGSLDYELDTTTLAAGTYTIDFYASTDLDGGQVEGARYLGSLTNVADGNSSLIGSLSGITMAADEYVTLITTDSSGNSSEFSTYAVSANDAPTFDGGGVGGYVTTDVGTGVSQAQDMVIGTDDKVLVLGQADNGSDQDISLVRYNTDGSLDTGFGGGIVITDIGSTDDIGQSVTLQADGKILLTGYTHNGTDNDIFLIRYNADGSLDASFGSGGIVINDFGSVENQAYATIVQADGKILVTGTTGGPSAKDILVIRYNTDGSLDATFGSGGIVTTDAGGSGDAGYDIVVKSNGQILVTGRGFDKGNFTFAVVLYNIDGSLDNSFGKNGLAETEVTSSSSAHAIALQDDGKIVVAGQASSDLAVARYNADGSLDTSFAGVGYLTYTVDGGGEELRDLVIQPDGKIVVTGYTGADALVVSRFNTDGSFDTTFNSTGILSTHLSGDGTAVALQSDGTILVAGYNGVFSEREMAVIGFDDDGSLSSTFAPANTLDGNPTFVEDGAAAVLDSDVDVNDTELDAFNAGNGNYAGASVTLVRNVSVSNNDLFAFNDGNGITLSGSNLIKNSQIIATFDTTTTAGQLVITFTDANGEIPTTPDVDNILRQITYANNSDTPLTSVQIDWMFSDGNTGSQGSGGVLTAVGSTTVGITAANDAPINTVPGTQAINEEIQTAISGISVTDVDAGSSSITTQLQVSSGTLDVILSGSAAILTGANSSTDLTIQGNVTDVNATLASLHYTGNTNVTGMAADTLVVTTDDGGNTGIGGALQDVDNMQIDITNVNDNPVGVPTITGTVTEDQTLTADTSGISDDDGLGAFSYQWLRDGANISGATNSTYTLGDADVGTQISVEVSYTDGEGTNEGPLTSAQTAAVTNVNDTPIGSPVITGTPTEDQTLTADTSGISDDDGLGAFSYQWLRDGANISGATASTYTLDDADVGTQISVEVTYTDAEGTNEGPITSAQTAAVTNVNDTPAGAPTITGTVTEDQTLTADTSGISDDDGLGAFSYQWLRDGANISGATNSTYTLGDADVGTQISVEVSYTDGEATNEGPLTSAQTAAVTNVNDTPIGSPVITGTPTEDQTLTADTSGISDDDGLGAFSYQWLRDGTNISGATNSTYTLGDADVGTQISVEVSYTDGEGTNEGPLTSAQTAAVTNVNDTPAGTPTITGTVTEDQTLMADTSGISDDDGLGAFSYQWLRDGANISGATNSTYTLGDADVGTQISIEVSYTDGEGTNEGPLTSAQTAAVTNVNDTPIGSPVITGTPTEDQTLTADTSGISDDDGLGAFSYQWLRDGANISGATASTYTLDDADVGTQISVEVTYTDAEGTNEGPITSAQTAAVTNVNDTPAGAPTITGTVTEDQTLTADTSGISDDDGLGAFSYQWLRDGAYISGATNSTYTLGDADVGTQISVEVSYTDGEATNEGPLTSAQTAAVTNVNDTPIGSPVITGTPTEDQTLTADTSGISDDDGLGAFSYQWLRDGANISGATNSTYTLGDADVGTQISVEVSYTDGEGTNEGPLTSAQTAAVTNVNDTPAGTPTITGTVTEDQTLTADTSGISDDDGLGAFSYQWLRDGANISGATNSTYTLGDADVGTQISVEVSYTDGEGTNEGPLTSAQTAAVTNVNDTPIGSPVITGTPTEDQTLTADTSGISDDDGLGAFSYQWLRDGANISGATASTYTLDDADVGTQISVEVTYTDAEGTNEGPITSAQTAAVTNVNDTPAGAPTITGTVTEDQTLTADTSGISDDDGLGAFSYQWLRDGANISGATNSTYTLGDADVGTQISVEVSYTDGEATNEGPLTSAQTAAVTNVNDTPIGSPVITGTPTEDQTLTADTSGISDDDGLGAFSYQWLRDGANISGATNSTYTLGDADVGTQISVEVSYTDGEGTNEGPLTSAQTAAVTNVNDTPAGAPTITGTVTEDQTLTADTSGISDDDGLGAFSYQWLRDGASISGASASTYSLDDADVGAQISVAVSYSDGEGTIEGPLTSAQTAAVTNVNDTPSLIVISNSTIAENINTSGGFSIGMLSTSDIDAGEIFAYSVVGGVDAAVFTIGDSDELILTNGDLDFESQSSYAVIIRSTDSGGLTYDQALIITVTDVNDAPEITSAGGGVTATGDAAENQTTVLTVTSTDVDGGTPTYSISGGAAAALFAINGSSGALTFNSAPDFETPVDAGANNIYDVTVQVADGQGGAATQAIAVTVTNVNEAPVIDNDVGVVVDNGGGNVALGISANENESWVIQVPATDVDAGATRTYSLTGGIDQAAFSVNSDTGDLNFVSAPDYEVKNSYEVELTVTDNGGLTAVQTLVINVQDVNESPTAQTDRLEASENQQLIIDPVFSLLSNDSDPEHDALTLVSFTQPHNGTLTQNAEGLLEFAPNSDFVGLDGFDYVVEDAGGHLASARVWLDVVALSDPLLAAAQSTDNGVGELLVLNPEQPEMNQPSVPTDVTTAFEQVATVNATGESGEPVAVSENTTSYTVATEDLFTVSASATSNNQTSSTAQQPPPNSPNVSFIDNLLQLLLKHEVTDLSTNFELHMLQHSLSIELHDAILTLRDQIDQMSDQSSPPSPLITIALPVVGASLTAGIVTWVLRSGLLISATITTSPLWRPLDPVPILAQSDDDEPWYEKGAKGESSQRTTAATDPDNQDAGHG